LGVRSPKKQGNEEKKQNGSPVGELYSSKKEIFLLSFPKKIVSLQSKHFI
jgi:hypothetical protein